MDTEYVTREQAIDAAVTWFARVASENATDNYWLDIKGRVRQYTEEFDECYEGGWCLKDDLPEEWHPMIRRGSA